MNNVIKKISLDVNSTSPSETVTVKRGDTGRELWFYLFEDGAPYVISKDCSAVFAGTKPDGKAIHNPCTIQADDSTFYDNCVRYEITEQTISASGKLLCEIRLYGADGKLLSCPSVVLEVLPRAYDEGEEIESSDEFNTPTELQQKFYDSGYSDGVDAVAGDTLVHLKSDKLKSIGGYGMYMRTRLESVDLPNVTTIAAFAFQECYNLKTVNLPKATTVGAEAFCYSGLQKIDFGSIRYSIMDLFWACGYLDTVIIRTPTMVANGSAISFRDTLIAEGNGYIYVPKALVDTYKAATNWSQYADQIRAIEDYPEITEG